MTALVVTVVVVTMAVVMETGGDTREYYNVSTHKKSLVMVASLKIDLPVKVSLDPVAVPLLIRLDMTVA